MTMHDELETRELIKFNLIKFKMYNVTILYKTGTSLRIQLNYS